MNRKQLEECAWTKTPTDERRAQKERYDWASQKTIVERLKGNAREVRVFDPSGSTEGTMSPWVPLWSLYSDELEQRCKEEREPKLRPPYNRMRADYTGDVESSPGTKATREGASRHHATKKKSPAQLNREIAHALAKNPRALSIGAAVRRHATKKPAGQIIEPLPHNRKWHDYIVGQGGELVARYKGQDIHRNGIAHYVNGLYVGTSLRRAKEYVRQAV